jgi:hypothetical protein
MAYKIIERSTSSAVVVSTWGAMEEILVSGTRVDVILAPGEALPGLRLDSNLADREELDLIRAINVPGGFARLYLDWQAYEGGRVVLRVSNDSTVEPAPQAPSRSPRSSHQLRMMGSGPGLVPTYIDQGGSGLHVAFIASASAAENPAGEVIQLEVSNDRVSWLPWAQFDPDGAGDIVVQEVLQLPFRFVRAIPNGMHGLLVLSAEGR